MFDSSFRRFGTPILLGPFGELPVRFVGSSRLSFRRFVMPFGRFVVAFVVALCVKIMNKKECRFVVSSCRFVVSTRPFREAIIRRTLHEWLSISHGFSCSTCVTSTVQNFCSSTKSCLVYYVKTGNKPMFSGISKSC